MFSIYDIYLMPLGGRLKLETIVLLIIETVINVDILLKLYQFFVHKNERKKKKNEKIYRVVFEYGWFPFKIKSSSGNRTAKTF